MPEDQYLFAISNLLTGDVIHPCDHAVGKQDNAK